MTNVNPSRKPAKPTAADKRPAKGKRRVGRPRSGKVKITTTIRPDLKRFAGQIGACATRSGKAVPDVSAGIERALEFYRDRAAGEARDLDANGWPIGFFEATIGMWVGDSLVRPPQGEYEPREAF